MNIWLAGLLAVLIVVGGIASIVLVFALIAASLAWLEKASSPTVKKILEVLFGVFVVICAFGTLAGLWYIVLSWIMGWPL